MAPGTRPPQIHAEEPSDQAGARTGTAYEYQYIQAAVDALGILQDPQKVVCVYCEWHDDYVVEHASTVYLFHQVKTRTPAKGAWKIGDFFEARGKRAGTYPPAGKKSPFARMYSNYERFGSRCERFVFVTDNVIDTKIRALLDDVASAATAADLTTGKKHFDLILAGVSQIFPNLTAASLFDFLKRLEVKEALGKLTALRDCEHALGGHILDVSEIDVRGDEPRRIGRHLVSLVRVRSHAVVRAPLPKVGPLRKQKALSLDDLFEVLSLSRDGYEVLKHEGRDAVLAVSRLQRLCKRNKTAEHLIVDMCTFKSRWDTWWLTEQNRIEPSDASLLKTECLRLLNRHAEESKPLPFTKLVQACDDVATKFRHLGTSKPLTKDHVLGRIFSLWVETAP